MAACASRSQARAEANEKARDHYHARGGIEGDRGQAAEKNAVEQRRQHHADHEGRTPGDLAEVALEQAGEDSA